MGWFLILALFPLVIFIFLILSGKVSIIKTSFISLLLTIIFVFFAWKMFPIYIFASLIKGIFVAIDILLIIFGAMFFLDVLRSQNILDSLGKYLDNLSSDHRVQAILIAWFLGNLIEGVAGFGTSAIIAAPILFSSGFSPLMSVGLSLLGNSTSVAFGAAGTPLKVGMSGFDIGSIARYSALFNFVGIIIPISMVWLVVREKKESISKFWEILPFAIWSGLIFTFFSWLSLQLGQEFPSILGSLVSLVIIILSIKLKFLLPKSAQIKNTSINESLFKTIFPYILLIALLISGKFILTGALKVNILAIINHSFSFFNPGIILFVVGLIYAVSFSKPKEIFSLVKKSVSKSIYPFIIIVFISSLIQLLINSGHNLNNISSAINLIARFFTNSFLPLFSPALGFFGTFLTGSATLSNILFSNIVNIAGLEQGFAVNKILGLLLSGAAAGNIVSLADILVAEASIGMKNQEEKLIKLAGPISLLYLLILGLLGIILIR